MDSSVLPPLHARVSGDGDGLFGSDAPIPKPHFLISALISIVPVLLARQAVLLFSGSLLVDITDRSKLKITYFWHLLFCFSCYCMVRLYINRMLRLISHRNQSAICLYTLDLSSPC